MRHLKAGKRLGVTTSHRRAMMRNMVTSLLEKQQIYCTLTRAKELRIPLDKMITLGKKGDLHARRQALKFIKSKKAMAMLFGELAERYQDRQGGYSRIIKLGTRRLGDNSEMVIIQLIDCPQDVLSSLKKPAKSRAKTKKKESSVLKEVRQEISSPSQPLTETNKSAETVTQSATNVSQEAPSVVEAQAVPASESTESAQETENTNSTSASKEKSD